MLSSEPFDFQTNITPQIHKYKLLFSVSFSRETEKQVICPGGFPVVGFLLTPFLHLIKWVHRQLLPNIFVWGKSDEACTIKTEEIYNTRRLDCLESSTTRQSLYQQAFRRRKMYCTRATFKKACLLRSATTKPQGCRQ